MYPPGQEKAQMPGSISLRSPHLLLRSGFKEPDVLAMARKDSIAEFPDTTGSDQTPATGQEKSTPLTWKTTDGKTNNEDLRPSKGSLQNPMKHEELENKCIIKPT